METETFTGLINELEKIAASTQMAGYMQARRGTRPHRVHNLLNRDSKPNLTEPNLLTQDPEIGQPMPAEPDTGEDDAQKTAGKRMERLSKGKQKALGTFAAARPYVASGVKAGLPLAVLGNLYGGKRAAKIFGAVGAGAGVANEALQSWAEKHKRRAVAKKILAD